MNLETNDDFYYVSVASRGLIRIPEISIKNLKQKMPPPKKKGCSIILFDINSEKEFKRHALQTYADICGRKFFQNSEDFTQLILVNTAETNNAGNQEFPGKYEHILEATPVVGYNPIHINLIEGVEPGLGNWLEGMLLGTEILEKKSEERGIYSLELLLFSDLRTPLQLKQKTANYMIEHMITKFNDFDIYVYILGPQVNLPFRLDTKADVQKWMKDVTFKDDGNGNPNYKIAKRLVQTCKGVMCDVKIGADLFTFFKRPKGKQPWLDPLTYNDVEMPAATSKIVVPNPVVYPTPIMEGAMEAIYVNVEDETEPLPSDFVDSLAMHDKLILIPPHVDKGNKEGDRCFKLVGFTTPSSIPADLMKSAATNMISVDEKRQKNAKVLEYLVRVCHKFNLYGIAQKVHMKNCLPKLFCLIPVVTEETIGFLMPEVEFAEGFSSLYRQGSIFAAVHEVKIESVKLKNDAYGFLDSKDASNMLKMHPNLKVDVHNKKIYRQFTQKYLGEEITASALEWGGLYTEASGVSYGKLQSSWMGMTEENIDDEEKID